MRTGIIQQFNRYASQSHDLVSKALTSAAGVGGALIPQSLEKAITDTVIRLSPELALVTAKKISGKTHEFNRLIERPSRGGAMGESATTGSTNSRTIRATVDLKVIRRKGKVTNFLKDASQEVIDAVAYEMENELQAHVIDMITYLLYGNKTSNPFEFDGLDTLIKSKRYNNAVGGAVPMDLSPLDGLIDGSNRKGGARHQRVFGMSPEMLSKFSRLLQNVRLNQGLTGGGLTQVDIGGGWRLNAYRDIPIIETSATSPIETMYPTITLAGVDGITGGALSDGTYYVQIAPITAEGEQEASAQQTVTLSAGTATQSIRISLNVPHKSLDSTGAYVESAYSYKVYCSATTGTETLKRMFTAFLYDAEGTVLSGNNLVGTNYGYVHAMTAAAEVPSHMALDVPLVATGGVRPEIVYLWDLDPIQGLGKLPYTNMGGAQFNGLVTMEELAKTDDFIQFLVKTYGALADAFEATSGWVRGLRTA
jgi:hypothetical protein